MYKEVIDKGFEENQWLSLPNIDFINYKLNIDENSNNSNLDYRTVQIEGMSIFRGNLMFYLKNINPLFDNRNLKFELGKEDMLLLI